MAAALFTAACSLMPERGNLRADEVEQALLPVANVALETGQLETAKRLYRRLLDIDPESQAGRMGLGDVAFKDRRPDDAARWYLSAQANAKTPQQRNDALLWHGRAALDAGQLTAARRSFERLVATHEEAPTMSIAWALNGIGLTLLLEGDLPGAVAAMERAVRKAPGEQMFADNLARALAMLAELHTREDADRAVISDATTLPPQDAPRKASADAVEPKPRPPMQNAHDPAVPPEDTPAPRPMPVATPEVAAAPEAAEQEPLEPQLDPADPTDAAEPAEPAELDAGPVQLAEPAALEPEMPEPDAIEPVTTEPVADVSAAQLDTSAATATDGAAPSTTAADVWWPSIETGYAIRTEAGVFVQMGAFAERTTADAVAYLLLDATHETVRVEDPRDGPDDTLYRVRIGPIESSAALTELADKLDVEGFGRPKMSQNDAAQFFDDMVDVDPSMDEFDDSSAAADALDGFVVREGSMRFLQLGAFEVRLTANRLADKLRQLTDHIVAVAEVDQLNGAVIYRVRVGPIESDRSFKELASVLIANGYDIDQPQAEAAQ